MVGLGGPVEPHTKALVALVFGAVALVGLGTGVLIGWAGSGRSEPSATPSASPTPTPPPASSSPPPARPTVRADSDVEQGRKDDIGYFLGARQRRDGIHVVFDRAQLLTGDAAAAYGAEHGLAPSMNGELVVNENPRTRDMVLSPDVQVFGWRQLAGVERAKQVPLRTLLAALDEDGSEIPLVLTYDELGWITEVREKELP